MVALTHTAPRDLLPPLPREHGAWFILAASALVGPVLTGRFGAAHVALVLGAYAALVGRSALRGPRPLDRAWAAFLLGFALVINVAIFVSAPSPMLLGAGAAAVLLGGVQLALEKRRLQRHVGAEAVGIGLLTALAPASLALCGLDAGPRALGVVGANALYFLVTVPFVRVRVFGPKVPEVWRAMRFDALVLATAGAIVMGASLGGIAPAAFAIPIARGLVLALRPPRPPRSVSTLGYLEVASTLAYLGVLWLA